MTVNLIYSYFVLSTIFSYSSSPVHQKKMEMLPDLWKEDYWLPPGVTWRDMEQMGDSNRPRPLDLLIALPLALGFVALRYMFER